MNPLLMTKRLADDAFLQDLKILLRKCQLILGNNTKQSAIVFDIDGTLLYEHTDYPIWSVINFCNHCKEIGIATIIVTARPGFEQNITKTKEQLKQYGLNCDAFYFRAPRDNQITTFKTAVRKYLAEQLNYNVLLSIGDNPWDIGEYGGTGIHMAADALHNTITYQVS